MNPDALACWNVQTARSSGATVTVTPSWRPGANGNAPRERRGAWGRGRRLPAGGRGAPWLRRVLPEGRGLGREPARPTRAARPGAGLLAAALPRAWSGRSCISSPVAIQALRPDSLLERRNVVRDGSRICSAEPGWVCPLVEHRGVVRAEGAAWLPRDTPGSWPVLGLNSESVSLRGWGSNRAQSDC